MFVFTVNIPPGQPAAKMPEQLIDEKYLHTFAEVTSRFLLQINIKKSKCGYCFYSSGSQSLGQTPIVMQSQITSIFFFFFAAMGIVVVFLFHNFCECAIVCVCVGGVTVLSTESTSWNLLPFPLYVNVNVLLHLMNVKRFCSSVKDKSHYWKRRQTLRHVYIFTRIMLWKPLCVYQQQLCTT